MPNLTNAKKALRQSKVRGERNLKIKADIKTLMKKIRQSIDKKEDKAKIQESVVKVQKMIDKAVKAGIFKINTSSRKKSRLMKYFHQGGHPSPKATNGTSQKTKSTEELSPQDSSSEASAKDEE